MSLEREHDIFVIVGYTCLSFCDTNMDVEVWYPHASSLNFFLKIGRVTLACIRLSNLELSRKSVIVGFTDFEGIRRRFMK